MAADNLNLARFSLNNPQLVYFAAFVLALSGVFSYLSMGWLEDPDISVKSAVVLVDYPGASPEEVELEVVEPLETKLQEMPQIKHIASLSRDGRAILRVDIKDEYWTPKLPQVWDELRRKVRDVQPLLPSGVRPPVIKDDYGSVFGFVLAVSSDGYSQSELQETARELRRELNLMSQVARVDLWGMQQRQVVIELLPSELTAFKVNEAAIARAFSQYNLIVDAGALEIGERQYALSVSGEAKSLEDLRQMLVSAVDDRGHRELVRFGDVARFRYDYADPATEVFRNNGLPGVALAIAPIQGANIVQVGYRLDQRLQELQAELPIGLTLQKVAWQSDYVADAVKGFMLSLVQAVLIVFAVLSVTMGLRMGLLIGGIGLGLTVLGSMTLMQALELNLHRVSLGALVVAMGMMVDNAIVVADGFVVRVQRGMSRLEAAVEAAHQPGWPLLGATIVAAMAFYPVFGSDASAAEYSRSLFLVVGLSLLLSWVVSQTIIPLLCARLLPVSAASEDGSASGFVSRVQGRFQSVIIWVMRRRLFTLLILGGVFVTSLLVSNQVEKQFFPTAKRDQFMVDYWAPEGTRLAVVSERLQALEADLLAQSSVASVSSFIGQGAPRFYLPIDPELPNPSFGQLLVTVEDAAVVKDTIAAFEQGLAQRHQEAFVRVRQFGVGAAPKWPVEIRVVGPANAELNVLRSIAEQVKTSIEAHPEVQVVIDNWRQRSLRMASSYSAEEGGWTGVGREDVARALKRSLDGETVGALRKGDEQHAIVLKTASDVDAGNPLQQVQVRSASQSVSIPLLQINKSTDWEWYDPIIWHHDRRRAITLQAATDGSDGVTVVAQLKPTLEALPLPDGYHIELAGEYQTNNDTLYSMAEGLPVALAVMTLVVVGLFNGYRASVLVFAVLPFALIGVFFGHWITGVPLSFVSTLGIYSLAGMMIKNSVVLLDQVKLNMAQNMLPYEALVDATRSRLMPVVNASLTTVLGLIPLLQDVFWKSMAVTIMFGLMAGVVITMLIVPVGYGLLFGVKAEPGHHKS
jgi:multidrug efflux pump subunit AcrB